MHSIGAAGPQVSIPFIVVGRGGSIAESPALLCVLAVALPLAGGFSKNPTGRFGAATSGRRL